MATKRYIAQRCLDVYADIISTDGYFPAFADSVVVDDIGDVGISEWLRFGLRDDFVTPAVLPELGRLNG